MKRLSILPWLVTTAGCVANSTGVGAIETDTASSTGASTTELTTSETDASSDEGTSTTDRTSTGDGSSSSGGSTACGGAEGAICLPEEELCLCPGELLASSYAFVVDLDGDGHDDVLVRDFERSMLFPYVSTPGGLVPHEPESLGDTPSVYDVVVDDAGIVTLLASGDDYVLLEYTLDGGLNPVVPATALSPLDVGGGQLGDFDGDGSLDASVIWYDGETESSGVRVTYDVRSATPTIWDPAPVELGPFSNIVCDVDGDGPDDLLLAISYVPQWLWGNPAGPPMEFGSQTFEFEGAPKCRDLDGDGDLDLLVPAGCGDCSPLFGGYTVYEQTAPRVFEVAQVGEPFEPDIFGGATRVARLFDPSEDVLVSLAPGETFGVIERFPIRFGVRRPVGPLQWEGTWAEGPVMYVNFAGVVDVDHDGIDELLVRVETVPDDPFSWRLQVYAVE